MRNALSFALTLLAASPALAHEPISWGGNEFHIVLDDQGTEGKMGMFTIQTFAPGGPGMHIHEDADEAFYLVEGTAEFALDDERMDLSAGQAVFIPKGAAHTFHVTDEDGAHLLVVVAPGGFEGFFSAVASENIRIPEDMQRLKEISADFNQLMTGPPLAAQ